MKRQDLLLLSVFTFIVVFVWVVSNLYHSWVTSTISGEQQIQLIPIEPNFDRTTIEKLKTRERVEPLYVIDKTETATPSATTQITEQPIIITSTPPPIPVETPGIVRQGEP